VQDESLFLCDTEYFKPTAEQGNDSRSIKMWLIMFLNWPFQFHCICYQQQKFVLAEAELQCHLKNTPVPTSTVLYSDCIWTFQLTLRFHTYTCTTQHSLLFFSIIIICNMYNFTNQLIPYIKFWYMYGKIKLPSSNCIFNNSLFVKLFSTVDMYYHKKGYRGITWVDSNRWNPLRIWM
jgi:hypothetical protein